MSAPQPSTNTSLTLLLTLLVLGLGGARAWSTFQASPPTAPPPAPEQDVQFEEDLGDLRALRWSSVRAVRGGVDQGPLDGVLHLRYSDRMHQDYPVIEGEVEVRPHRLQLLELTRSHELGVSWEGGPERVIPLPWLVEQAGPQLIEQQVASTATRATVRNPSIVPLRVRIKAGWREGQRWINDPARGEHSASAQEFVLPPGGSRAVELTYASGPPGATLGPPMVRPIF